MKSDWAPLQSMITTLTDAINATTAELRKGRMRATVLHIMDFRAERRKRVRFSTSMHIVLPGPHCDNRQRSARVVLSVGSTYRTAVTRAAAAADIRPLTS